MIKPTLLVHTAILMLSATLSFGQLGQQLAMQNSPAYEAAAAPLRSAPPRQYNFSKAVLSDVMRLMAEDAGIGFFGLPDGADGGDRLVTFTLTASPFVALETLAQANGVTLIPKNGIWYLRPANDQELIGRIYEINYNAQEVVTKNSEGGGGGGGFSAGGGAGGSAGGAGGASAGLNLQGSPDFFVTEPSRILEDLQNILDIPTTGGAASFAPTASVDNLAQLSVAGLPGNQSLLPRGATSTGGDSSDGAGQSKVIWNSDSNTLYVVATRQQHQWIEAYLASADRPQPMIAVEVKFIETSRDPSSEFGIDWDGVLGDNGLDVTLSDNTGPIDLNRVGGYSLPTAVLSYSDLTWKLRAIYEDRNTKAVSFPRMVTLDNREVSFRSVINQPVLGSSASASLGAGGTQTSSIEYLPIGTVINILPKRMAGEKILLNVSVTVSDIVGTEFINGNPFPIATSRVYTAPLTVKSGYTVAISGLDAARSENSERGVPVLGKIPVLGNAFRNRRKDRSRQHLMMLITPIALDSGTQGLTEKPTIREPWKPAPGYGKVPVDCEKRTNADLDTMVPIEDIPTSDETPETRKADHTFRKNEAEVETMPLIATPIEVRKEERSFAARVGESNKPQPEMTTSNTDQPDRSGGYSAVLAGDQKDADRLKPVPDPRNTPMIVETPAEALGIAGTGNDPKETPVATADETPNQKEPAEKMSAVDQVKVAVIREGLEKIQQTLTAIPDGDSRLSPDDAQSVVNAHDETESLLSQVEEIRAQTEKPLVGELGDIWWQLINLKTQAVKMSRRSPESLALQVQED